MAKQEKPLAGNIEVTYFDDSLQQLQKQTARKKQLSAFVRELRIQRGTLREQVSDLQAVLAKEQKDVDRLQMLSPAALFYQMLGTKDRKLEQEQIELWAAKAKFDAAARELDTVEQTLRRYEGELETLADCEVRYEKALSDRTEALKSGDGALAREILELEKKIGFLENQKKELQEAIQAGNKALSACDQVQTDLGRAKGWSTWDMAGGGLASDIAKYGALEKAQSAGELLQSRLRSFKTELADIKLQADMGVYIGNFTKFGDIFFNNLFFDLSVREEISGSLSQAEETRRQILGARAKLESMKDAVEQEQKEIKAQLSQRIMQGGKGTMA